MSRLPWLTAVPIAHRGLHDRSQGVIENTPTAVARAVERGFAIEIDVQETADGAAVVFHDGALERLTEGSGPVAALTLSELRRIPFKETTDRFWTLEECFDLVGGRSTLVVEIKVRADGSKAFAARTARAVAAARGPTATKSFDPRAVRAARLAAPRAPCGIIGEAFRDDDPYWAHLTRGQRFVVRNLLHWPWSRPDFLSWSVRDLPRPAVSTARALGRPLMAWTVRTAEEQARARAYADQMVFEGFLPG